MRNRNDRDAMVPFQPPLVPMPAAPVPPAAAPTPYMAVPPAPLPGEVAEAGLLRTLWRRKWIVVFTIVLAAGGAFGYLSRATRYYTSTSRLLIEPSEPKILSDAGSAEQSATYLYTQAELIKSVPILTAVLDKPEIKSLRTFQRIENPLEDLKQTLAADVGKRDDIVSVSFDSPYPQEAALLVNDVVDSYIEYQSSQKRTSTGEVLKILQREKDKRDAELQEQLKAMLDFRQRNGALSFSDDRGNVITQRLAQLSNALTTAQLQTINAQAAYEMNQTAVVKKSWIMAQKVQLEIEREYAEQQKEALALNNLSVQSSRLEQEVQRAQTMVEALDTRIKEIGATRDTGALNISVIEAATPGLLPTRPDKVRVLALALVGGLVLGVGLAQLRDSLDQRLRTAEQVVAALGMPILGVVPQMNGRRAAHARGQKVRLDPTSDVAEAYRTVRTAVYFGLPGQQIKTLLVTSPCPGEGKSTSASNLAIAMARAGQRTLLMDADFRRPMQQKIFEIKEDVGLSSVLAGQASLEQAIHRTAVEGLDILPCGPIPMNPSEILQSEAFGNILDDVAGRYHQVVVDSPPVLRVTDARILGAVCDATLLVVRADRSTRKQGERARDGLLSVGARILGVVVNGAPRRRNRDGYYGYYGGGYSSSNGESVRNRRLDQAAQANLLQ